MFHTLTHIPIMEPDSNLGMNTKQIIVRYFYTSQTIYSKAAKAKSIAQEPPLLLWGLPGLRGLRPTALGGPSAAGRRRQKDRAAVDEWIPGIGEEETHPSRCFKHFRAIC